MKLLATIALCLAVAAPAHAEPVAARASGSPGPGAAFRSADGALLGFDLFSDFVLLAADAALIDAAWSEYGPAAEPAAFLDVGAARPAPVRDDAGDPPPPWRSQQRRARRPDARQGFLFSFGLGGAGLHVSPQDGVGAFDFDLRMGYGFSDRFQLFGDLTVDSGQYNDGSSISSYTLTVRGQTVLIGDRDGNGLNVNAGIGLGGVSRSICGGYCYSYGYGYGYDQGQSSPIGLAAGAGLSYDARLGQSFRLSPEFFFNWHQVPNGTGKAADIATAVGFRLNFLWYIQ